MEVEINKNTIYNQEVSTKNIKLKIKIFDYFYLILNKKNKTSKYTLCFLHILEFIQIISFAFYEQHLNTWKISQKNMEILSIIISSFRLAPIINYTTYEVYKIILIILIFLLFCFFLTLIMQILFRKEESKIYKGLLSLTHILIAPLTIYLYIPINEYLLLIFKCNNDDDIPEIRNTLKCWTGIHLLYVILSLIAVLLLFLCLSFLNFFYYYPFQTETSTIKLNSTLDIISLIVKFGYLLRLFFIKDEYISIIILILFSFILTFQEIKNPTYNCNILEIVITIRNSLSLWTFFILFIAKICENIEINGLIYLVFIGYPIIIVTSIMFIKEYENEFNFKNSNSFHNIKSCLSKTRILIMLINSFLDKNNINRKNKKYGNKNDILLKGMIKMHTEICLDEECPLKKFIKNYGNFNVQKQCLLNYMAIYFHTAMKRFPYNKILRLYYIQFNFSKKYNLNSVRTNLEYIKKMKNNIKEEFIIYYLENEINKVKNKILNSNDGNELEQEYTIHGQNYKRLKDLIINITKLYVEFWGIFSINITNNLNILKLNKIGEQLNIYLNEINYLWENNLKNKKINIENESVAQLYSKFVKEILWDKNGSEEVQNKINEEYHTQGYKRMIYENKKLNNINNIENMLENQDNILYVNSNEKGKCNIIQFSNSLSYLIGYQKQEIINKPLEILMPSIFIEGHAKKVEEFIKTNHLNRISKDSFREIDKKKSFILIKSKMGYLIPFNAKYTVFDDNDFSNSYLIKAHLEPRDAKSMYAYYILTKDDFSIDNISSSAINLGLTMDLLKKYVIKLNILIRTSKDNDLNLFEKYKYFEEEPKKINWVYPDVIYPKNDTLKIKDKKIEDLIKISNKKRFNLQIIKMKYKENQIIGFVFKFIEIQKKNKIKNEILFKELLPPNRSEIIFDLLTLSYIRTILVQKKSGLRNLRDNKIDNEIKSELQSKRKKLTEHYDINEVLNEDSVEEVENIELTKDKILELQTKDSNEIQSFINIIPFYGEDITLIRHRPNKDEYLAGKTREPLIRIDLNHFINRIDSRLKDKPYRKIRNIKNEKRGSLIIGENERIKSNFISSIEKDNENNNKEKNEINKNLISDSSISLSNIFNEKSIIHIKIVDFIIYIFIFVFFIIEFCLTYMYINNTKKKFNYLDNSNKILVNLVYCKYFITEAIITNTIPNYFISLKIGKNDYITYLKSELTNYHKELSDLLELYLTSSIKFSNNITNYISYKNITIKTLNNGIPKNEELSLISALNRLSTSIFYVSTISDLQSINITDKYSYELMMNLLNGYFMTCSDIYTLIFDEIQSNHSRFTRKLMIIISLILSIISLFFYYKKMQNFMCDITKPINLFLTIKKQLFENLKYSAENFSNKLLNKFFGNEENEEESQLDYSTIIKSNDINIAKFKTVHEYKSSKKGYSLMLYFGQLLVVLILFEIYNIIKYFYIGNYLSQIHKFNDIYATTQISHEYIVIRINIIKQYFFNNSLSSFNLEDKYINLSFYNSFHDLSLKFTETILKTSKTDSFLKDEYIELFKEYLYRNFSDCIKNKNIINDTKYADKILNGFKPIKIEVFELLRSLFIQYFYDNKTHSNISELINNEKWYDVHEILVNIIQPWYKYIIEQMISSFYSSLDNILTINISFFILTIVLNTIVYCIIWKSYEEKLHNLLKKSFELINLIPKEIKCIIVSKMNE